MAKKEIYISLNHTEAGLGSNYTTILKSGFSGSDKALGYVKGIMRQILQGLYDKDCNIMKARNPVNTYVKLINFKPIQEL